MHRSEDDGNRVRNSSPSISVEPVESGNARVQIGGDVWAIRFKDAPLRDADGRRCKVQADHPALTVWLDPNVPREQIPALVAMAVSTAWRTLDDAPAILPPALRWMRKLTLLPYGAFGNRRGIHIDVETRHVSATPNIHLLEMINAIGRVRDGHDDGDDDDDDTPPPAPEAPVAVACPDVRPGEFGRITLAGRTFILRTTPDRHFCRAAGRIDEYRFNIDADAGEILISETERQPQDAVAEAVRAVVKLLAEDVPALTPEEALRAKWLAELRGSGHTQSIGSIATIRDARGEAWACPLCRRRYRTPSRFGKHLRGVHGAKIGPDDVFYVCP